MKYEVLVTVEIPRYIEATDSRQAVAIAEEHIGLALQSAGLLNATLIKGKVAVVRQ